MKIDGYSLLATVDCAQKPSQIEAALRESGYTIGLGAIDGELPLADYLRGEALLDAHISGADTAWLCAAMKISLADGREQRTVETPRSAAGPDLRFLFLGGADKSGSIKEVDLRIRTLPEKMLAATFIAHDLETALKLLRKHVQNFNPPAWLRLTLPDDDIQSDQTRLSVGYEGQAALCAGQFEEFLASCSDGFTRISAAEGFPDGEHQQVGAPALFAASTGTHRAEVQMSVALSWENCAGFMSEMKKRSAGIYAQQCVLSKACHHAALISLRLYSSGVRDWVESEAREICTLTQSHDGRVLELRDLAGDRADTKKLIPPDSLIDRIRRAL